VKAVNTLVRKGKTKRFRGMIGRQSDVKKAYRDACRWSVDRRLDRSVRAARNKSKGNRKMALKSYNPTTPSQRQLVIVDRSGLHRGKPVKSLTEGLTEVKGGRNNAGRVTARRSAAVTSAPTAWSTSSVASSTSRHRRASGIRSEPDRVHRADHLCRRRAVLHSGAAASRCRRQGDLGRQGST
jgi:hypothetical protein